MYDFTGTAEFYDQLQEDHGIQTPGNQLYHNLLIEEIAKLPEADQVAIAEEMQYCINEDYQMLSAEEITEGLNNQEASPNTITFAQLLKHDLYDPEGTAELYEYLQGQYGLDTPDGNRYHYLIIMAFAKLAESDQLEIIGNVRHCIEKEGMEKDYPLWVRSTTSPFRPCSRRNTKQSRWNSFTGAGANANDG
ncbi:hypothetical protein [Lewinella sp. IMCC34191]|uniref:hypothetical protein n=1 Tax=Lewinella sp. IMCC34191 TaxID=2259172 RepID=UPI000E2262B0|nr:hypothetical protein [Lewinella sp. IMCC34191]